MPRPSSPSRLNTAKDHEPSTAQPAAAFEQIAAADHALREGRLAHALALAEAAWQGSAASTDFAERRRAGLLLATLRFRAGQLAPMVELSSVLLPDMRAQGPQAELVDTLRMTTLAACELGRSDLAMACAQEAHRAALALGDAPRTALATDAMACVFERAGDPWQARRLMAEAVALARRTGDDDTLVRTLNNLAGTLIGMHYLLRDVAPRDEALAPLLDARPLLEEALALGQPGTEPLHAVFCGGNLGEVLVLLGELPLAQGRLDHALDVARRHGMQAQVSRIACSAGELLLQQGQPQQACDILHQALVGAEQADQRTTRLRIHHALWRASQALGQTQAALDHLQAYVLLDRARALGQMRALSELFVTRVEAELALKEAQQLRHRATALEQDSRRDELTGLGNRRQIDARWPGLVAQAQARQAPLSVVMLDLDHFKHVNDRFGHGVGDKVLVTLADLLRAHTRSEDLLVRMGGEEFLLVMGEPSDQWVHQVCERLRQRVAAHDWASVHPGLAVTISLGLACAPPYDFDTLVHQADLALYQAKAGGRNRLVRHGPSTTGSSTD